MIRGGDDYFIIMYVVSPCDSVSVSSLGYFSPVGSSSKPSRYSFTLSIRVFHTREYFKKKRGSNQKFIKSHQEMARCE